MSFNQISGKVHGRQLLSKRYERQNSRDTTIPGQQQPNMMSQNDSCRDLSVNDQSPMKKDSIFSLPSIRRESLGNMEKMSLQHMSKRKSFFNEVYLQQNQAEEKVLSPVIQSRFSIKMPKKLSLNRAQQRAIEQQKSIIFNYLNEKVLICKSKKKKKKKILSKSAQKQQKMNRLYAYPTSDPRIHRRQKTQFKMTKSSKLDLGQVLQKRRSLDESNQKNLYWIKRQAETLNKQEKLLDELKKRVNEVQRYQTSFNKLTLSKIPFQMSKKKYSLSNRTVQSGGQLVGIKNTQKYHQSPPVFQTTRRQQAYLNTTNRTIEKTPKNLKFKTERKQSPRKIAASVVIPFVEKQFSRHKEQNLADTIKYKDQSISKSSEQPQVPSQEDSSQAYDSKLKEGRVQGLSSEEQSNTSIQIETPVTKTIQIKPDVLKQKDKKMVTQKIKTNPTQPQRIPDKYFLNLKTYYSQISNNPKITTSAISLTNTHTAMPFVSKQIPAKQQIATFIEHYHPQNQQISISKLISSQNFQVILEQHHELYFGQIVSKLKSGLGVTIRHNYLYEGRYLNAQKIKGLEITQSGKYYGQFKNNKKQGKGKFQWKNGQLYDGEWLNGKKHGHGTWKSLNGDTYAGQWLNGKVQGQGIHTSITGQKYEGSFHEYLKSGWGKQLLPNGDTYQGQFLNGKPNGNGKYKWKQGQVYKGEFKDGFKNGYGTLKDQNGNQVRGYFEKESVVGKCEMSFKGQDSYQGFVENAKFNGKGTLILYEQEQIWKGQWVDEIFFQDQMQEE